MSDNFYRAFEDRYRGSREVIKARLNVYHPFLKMMDVVYPGSSAIDLGCGRGEWLEILKELGFKGVGVDLDADMLSSCIDLGLDVKKIDALSALSSLQDESQSIVSAFHLVEHLKFDDVKSLIRESLRILKPGGLLILETPNPENIVVGANSFYLDPSHERPIPPMLLSFAAEFYGFKNVKIMRLQDASEVVGHESVSLFDVLYRVSPDYAVMSQKSAGESLLQTFFPLFNKEYGASLINLTERFDARIKASTGNEGQSDGDFPGGLLNSLNKSYASEIAAVNSSLIDERARSKWLENEWNNAKKNFEELSNKLIKLEIDLAQKDTFFECRIAEIEVANSSLVAEIEVANSSLVAEIEVANSSLVEEKARSEWLKNEWDAAAHELNVMRLKYKSATLEVDALTRNLEAMQCSLSWRITWPIRRLVSFLRYCLKIPALIYCLSIKFIKLIFLSLLKKFVALINRHTKLKLKLIQMVAFFPSVDIWLRGFLKGRGDFKSISTGKNIEQINSVQSGAVGLGPDLSGLTQEAKEVYLKIAKFSSNRFKAEG